MKITSHQSNNPKIEIIEVGGLTGIGALELQDWLYNRLDEAKGCQLINCGMVTEIDGLGINILERFLDRCMQIRLFDVGSEMRSMLEMAGKGEILRIYNETGSDRAVSLFEEKISGREGEIEDSLKRRRYPRINTFFPVEFTYYSGHNELILCKAKVMNMSERGICAKQVKAINKDTGVIVGHQEIVGQEPYNLKFDLGKSSGPIETKGGCVWKDVSHGKLDAGICFKDMREDYKETVRGYIYKDFGS